MIKLEEYLCGLTPELHKNAEVLVEKVNKFLEAAFKDGIKSYDPVTTSGWRPQKYNHLIQGSRKGSKHVTCEAVDLYDPDGFLGGFARRRIDLLESLDLWCEDPSYTKGWLHLQTKGVFSGKRIFIP